MRTVNLGRFVLALLLTVVLCLVVNQAQAQTSYNTASASADERLLKLDLWDQLYADDTECIVQPTSTTLRKWCGIIYDDLVDINKRITVRAFLDHGYFMLNDMAWEVSDTSFGTLYGAGFYDFDLTFSIFYIDMGEFGYIEMHTLR